MGSGVRDKCETPAKWALQFSKCPALFVKEKFCWIRCPPDTIEIFCWCFYKIENCFD
jgi:hypothetical protein